MVEWVCFHSREESRYSISAVQIVEHCASYARQWVQFTNVWIHKQVYLECNACRFGQKYLPKCKSKNLCVLPDLNCSLWKDLSITVPVALGRHTATGSVLPADLTKETLASRSALSQVHFGITFLISGGESELLDPVHLHKRVIKLYKERDQEEQE